MFDRFRAAAPASPTTSVRDLLLVHRGLVFVQSRGELLDDRVVRGLELELAEVGYVLSQRLRARLAESPVAELTAFRDWAPAALRTHVGGNVKHRPLFRKFPKDVPDDTDALWWSRVLVHFLQAEGQPCIHCRGSGTTHVLDPCRHVVCDQCFDGANYSACPICHHDVDRGSPFFQPEPPKRKPDENVIFKLLDLGDDEVEQTRQLLLSLVQRKQALSPFDRAALSTIVDKRGADVLDWLPAVIPVRENIALVFAPLFESQFSPDVLEQARQHMTTATDVLRFIAVLSGTDGSLLPETFFRTARSLVPPPPFWRRIARVLGVGPVHSRFRITTVPIRVNRFKVAKLSRRLRRALLALLEGMDAQALTEDMLRHPSYWVWVGEFLHPHEYASRFPNVARAFQVVRKKAPDGTPAPAFRTWASRVDDAFARRDVDAMVDLMSQRPGEFARRLDHALRIAAPDEEALDRITEAFTSKLAACATPVLMTLRSHLPCRLEAAPARYYWPKGKIAKGVSTSDQRPVLPESAVSKLLPEIDRELLARFAQKPKFSTCIIDTELREVMVPFNERTATASAVSLPRGSAIPVALDKTVRLFMHWCEPEVGGRRTDLDLSVALYDASWNYVGVCSYYQLEISLSDGRRVAQSAGDLQSAPWPEGATEFVDLYLDAAVARGARYAVMVVNAYAGLPFSLLERGFAGLMLRDDPGGEQFDARTVELKFELDGENGVFMPLVLDLRDGRLHWLDVHSKGQFEMNNVESSSVEIATICPGLIRYFASGTRPCMFDLALLHAAARCERVIVRDGELRQYERHLGEQDYEFHARMLAGAPTHPAELPDDPVLALLFRGDLDLPDDSASYALFRERMTPTLQASDLLS